MHLRGGLAQKIKAEADAKGPHHNSVRCDCGIRGKGHGKYRSASDSVKPGERGTDWCSVPRASGLGKRWIRENKEERKDKSLRKPRRIGTFDNKERAKRSEGGGGKSIF